MTEDSYRSFFGVPGLSYSTKLRQYEGFVRERLAGCAVTDPMDAHLAMGGTVEEFDEHACRATTGLLLIFGYEPQLEGVYLRKEAWPEDKRAVGRRLHIERLKRLNFGPKRGKAR